MAQDSQVPAAGNLFDRVVQTPAVQSLARRLENGGALSCVAVSAPAQPFVAALLHQLCPNHHIIVVTENLKTQESFQQDLETWIGSSPLFYPSWETLPHEGKLPHADIISDRLQTLVALSNQSATVVTRVTALLQKTFAPSELCSRTRLLTRGDRANPLDLVEWLEEQGYEPEAQVTQKGEIALRGGILDVYPLTSPWPVRLEFFGDELESLRYFDPLTQISCEEITSITLPPAGELGILKQGGTTSSLLDYLPPNTIFLLCEPESLTARADEYAQQVPADDPFFISWEQFQNDFDGRGMVRLSIGEGDDQVGVQASACSTHTLKRELQHSPAFTSLDAFRPLGERAPDPQIAEAQRHEFFNQLHRWLRQDYAVHVFCNNDGEKQRFEEIWKEYGFNDVPSIHIGTLSRGFLCEDAKLVIVTDAEIFGRYRIQRPRRLKSPHAAAMRSALEIDFADLEYGDLVVHLQHGIGRYLGLKNLPATTGKSEIRN